MSRRSFIALALVLDALFVNVGIAAAFFVRFGGIPPAFNFNAYLGLAPVITLVYLGACYIYGLYEPERTEGAWSIFRSVFMAVTLGAILTAAVAFLAGPRFFSFSRFAIGLGWLFDIVLLVGWRLAFMAVTQIRWPEQRVLVVGTGKVARELARELAKRSRWGVRVVGFLSAGAEEGSDAPDTPEKRVESGGLAEIDELPLLGGPSEAGAVAAAHGVHRIIIVSPVELRDVIERLVIADELDVRVDVVPELYEVFIGTLDGVVADIPLMEITRTGRPRWYGAFKRVADAVFAFVLLVALSLPLIVVAIAITISMGWPVLYVQERVGAQGRPFRLYKFRTMVRDAESASGPVLASTGDARITPFGRFLRTYRIDELPQLVNILKGEMSFVGPRPERQYFVERHIAEIPGYRERFKIQPGVTGLAQVSGDYATTPERKLKYDLIYMYHQNLIMDLQIIAETIRVVLTGKGAR